MKRDLEDCGARVALEAGCTAVASNVCSQEINARYIAQPTTWEGCGQVPVAADPEDGASRLTIIRIVVDFPAPLGPRTL
jgi:hypothetical protein